MLTSSDAKWRCLWHMFVWSVLLTLVSQCLDLVDHIAFWMIALASVFLLPVVTAVYSNTAGRRGAGVLRASYVFCDPVLASLTITPVLLLNSLPVLVDRYICYQDALDHKDNNITEICLYNASQQGMESVLVPREESTKDVNYVMSSVKTQLLIVQVSVIMPVLLALLMGKRSRKMSLNTYLLCFSYWLVVAVEATDLIQTALLHTQYKHIIYTSEATITIVMIVTNSYAVVTLCSYITPVKANDTKKKKAQFNILYKMFIGVAAIVFVEVPLLVARFRVLALHISPYNIPGTFYFWLIKDLLLVPMISLAILYNKFGHHLAQLPCQPALLVVDTPNVLFQPEKRDEYIVKKKKKVRFEEPVELVRTYSDPLDVVRTYSEPHEVARTIPEPPELVRTQSEPGCSTVRADSPVCPGTSSGGSIGDHDEMALVPYHAYKPQVPQHRCEKHHLYSQHKTFV